MFFLSIDVETTGLDPTKHGITEFAAVFADEEATFDPKVFYRWVDPDNYCWSNYCLRLHSEWMRACVTRIETGMLDGSNHNASHPLLPRIIKPAGIESEFRDWLVTECGLLVPTDGKKWSTFTPAGKNYSTFDKNFLDHHGVGRYLKHRALDPAMIYKWATDKALPDLLTCKLRAMDRGCVTIKDAEVKHDALSDAWDVVHLLQFAFKSPEASS